MAGQLAMPEPGAPNARRARGRILQPALTIFGLIPTGVIPCVERVTLLFRFLGGVIVPGRVGRPVSTVVRGTPHSSYLAAMAYEPVVVPATIAWRATIAER
jgi:hypothetical protein